MFVDGLIRFGFSFFFLILASFFVLLMIFYKFLVVLTKKECIQMEAFRMGGVFVVFLTSCILESLISWKTLTPMMIFQLLLFLNFWSVINEHSVSTS